MRVETLRRVEQLEPRAVLMAACGGLLLLLLAAWFYVLQPALVQYRALSAERLQAERDAQPADAPGVEQDAERLAARIESLEATLAATAADADAMVPTVMSVLAGLAERHAVTLVGVKPLPVSRKAGFEEQAFDVEATGGYFAVARWLAEAEAALHPVRLRQMALRAGSGEDAVAASLQLAYWRPATPP